MALEQKDLEKFEQRTTKMLATMDKKRAESDKGLHFDIKDTEEKLESKMTAMENRIIATVSREINDLAEINHQVIKRIDKINELEIRIVRLETKAGIKLS